MRRERGSTSIVMVGVLAVAVAAAVAAGRMGVAAIASARADAAADAAALAAADMLALGRGPGAAAAAARATARSNDAHLDRCSCAGRIVTVRVWISIVGLADAHATARAEIGGRAARSALDDPVAREVGEQRLRAAADREVRA
ncbi:MAG: hypothetical protein WEA75_01575 [Acidimicrobiia bacterium]